MPAHRMRQLRHRAGSLVSPVLSVGSRPLPANVHWATSQDFYPGRGRMRRVTARRSCFTREVHQSWQRSGSN